MSQLRRLVLVRHGETDGESSIRYHGSADVELNAAGERQMHEVAYALRFEPVDRIVASPLRRAWRSARILSGGAPVSLDHDLREIHFGRWEGLTKDEIAASDPVLFKDWQDGAPGFEFPNGEPRAEFRERVARALGRIQAGCGSSVIVVAHKGVVRAIAEQLLGQPLPKEVPEIGHFVELTKDGDAGWFLGRRGSNPPGLDEAEAAA